MSTCNRAEALRDYAFEELAGDQRRSMEQHISTCAACAAELDQLRVTTAALRALPDREIPQRIAFVSDKVFAPSAAARFFGGVWNSAARLGFVSACVVGGALIYSAYHRPALIQSAPIQTASAQTNAAPVDVTKQINEAVAKAVAQVHSEDAAYTKTVLAEVDLKNKQDHRAMMEAFTVMQDHMNTSTLMASAENRQTPGTGQ